MGKWTRRGFITAGVVGGAALVVGVAIRPGDQASKVAKYVKGKNDSLVTAWIKIGLDNKVTAIVPHSEMGQGAQTALSQMLADELDANWDDVSFIEAPAEDAYANFSMAKGYILGDANIPKMLVGTVDGVFLQATKAMHLQITGGSASVRTTGVYGMRVAGAAAKALLLESAAEAWQVPLGELSSALGYIHHKNSDKSAPYAEFAAVAGEKTPSSTPRLKTPEEFTIMGKDKPRFDIPAKVDGSAQFGIDASVPDMKIATVQAAPVFGATVKGFNAEAVLAMPGVSNIVNLDDAVAVVAQGYWQAKQALALADIQWTSTQEDSRNSDGILSQFRNDIKQARAEGKTEEDKTQGNPEAAFASASRIVERQYSVPYLAHACMEPMNALARVANGRCEIWTGTQNPLGFKHSVAEALEIDSENVSVSNFFMGGGFGRRSNADVAIQAARISQKTGHAVKLIWSREEDMGHDHYRPAVASDFRAALGENGLPTAWENTFVDKHEPVEAPYIPYAIDHQDIAFVNSPTHIPFGPWRSVDHSQHGFFTESFVDELAHEAQQDPYEFRRGLLSAHPRHLKVLNLAAEKANWQEPLPEGKGRGISLQESFGSIVAEVVEVSVNDGVVSVDRVVVAIDAGFAVSPNGLIAQMESGVIYGLTAALYGEINIENGQVKEQNFDSYPMVRMATAPVIDTFIINSHESWGGAGEPGTPGTAPALTNAIFAATGERIRSLPVSTHKFT